jgi:hypothetical protein
MVEVAVWDEVSGWSESITVAWIAKRRRREG